jgi:hypothetical protein
MVIQARFLKPDSLGNILHRGCMVAFLAEDNRSRF